MAALAGGGLLALMLAGCDTASRPIVSLTSLPDSSSETALVVAWVLLVAVGGAALSTVVRRGGTRRTSFVHAVEVSLVASAGMALVGLAAVIALAGWIASRPPRVAPSLLQVSITQPPNDPLGFVTVYLSFLLPVAGEFLLLSILVGRAGCPGWRRVRGARGVVMTILRVAAFVLALLQDVVLLGALGLLYLLQWVENPAIVVSAPGDEILLGLLSVTVLTAKAVLLVRLLFREFLGPRQEA